MSAQAPVGQRAPETGGRAGAARPTVCLVRPAAVESLRLSTSSVTPPLGLAYIAASLEQAGTRVVVVDAVAEAPKQTTRYLQGFLIGLTPAAVVERIPAAARTVGVSVGFTHEWPAASQLIAELKAARPDVTIVVGGEHVSAMPEFSLATSLADVLVLGEGEETAVELIATLERTSGDERARQAALPTIDGIAWRDRDGSLVVNRRRARTQDVDSIPRPAWHLFDIAAYNAHRYVGGMWSEHITIPLLATRGCPYQCTYCSSPNMWTTRWLPRDPAAVVDEIEHLVRAYGARNFPFHDLTAILRKDWIVAFCTELLRRELDITWQLPSGTRAEAVDAEVADLLRRSGMVAMAYAPEAASETTRRLVKKRMATDALMASIDAATDAGLNVSVFFVIGFPHETAAERAENLALLDELAARGVTDVSVTFYLALPGTELFLSLYDAGAIRIDRDWFRHVPEGLGFVPRLTFGDAGRWRLAREKLRIFLRFYRQRRRALRQAIGGLRGTRHTSKLQTATRSALSLAWRELSCRFRAPWMSRADERELLAGWDDIFRDIRRARLDLDVTPAAPLDTTTLADTNVTTRLAADHGAPRKLSPVRP